MIANIGLRLGEALNLEWPDIDFNAGTVYVRSKPNYRIKDRQERKIQMNDAVRSMLVKRYMTKGESQWVFPSSTGNKKDQKRFFHGFKKIAAQADLGWVNPQSIRRAFASINAQYMEPFVLQHLMGHSSVHTT